MTYKDNSQHWFVKMLNDYGARTNYRHGWKSAISKKANIQPARISDWLVSRSLPDIKMAEAVISALGGDITRGLPGYTPPAAVTEVVGIVEASTGTVSIDKELSSASPQDPIWHNSRWQPSGKAEQVYLRISGTQMAPEFPENGYLVCARWSSSEGPTSGQPVIAKVGDKYVLRKWSQSADGDPVLLPIVETHLPVVSLKGVIEPYMIILGVLRPL
ncbi:MAG: hypothetical protein PHX74_07485 [Candidatus Sumerlaeales bacterium]|nr:hypothetical protein [Candidatus Sumerlaeales bacterium]